MPSPFRSTGLSKEAPILVADFHRIKIAPHSQCSVLGFRLEIVPLTERASLLQQILESGVGTPSAEKLSNVVEIAGQELTGEVQRDRLSEIEISLVRYWQKFLGVVDVIRQYVEVIAELGMTIELARLLAQKNLMLAPAGGADEFEGFPYVLQADKHGDRPR
jgi:hypothetical protein